VDAQTSNPTLPRPSRSSPAQLNEMRIASMAAKQGLKDLFRTPNWIKIHPVGSSDAASICRRPSIYPSMMIPALWTVAEMRILLLVIE
jgi:hypothetical protein